MYRRATVGDILAVCELGQILNRVHHLARPDINTDATLEFARDEALWLPCLQAENQATFLANRAEKHSGRLRHCTGGATDECTDATVKIRSHRFSRRH